MTAFCHELRLQLPASSRLFNGSRTLGVGLIATRAVMGAEVEMPPKMPPAWLEVKPSRVMQSGVCGTGKARGREPLTDLHALNGIHTH